MGTGAIERAGPAQVVSRKFAADLETIVSKAIARAGPAVRDGASCAGRRPETVPRRRPILLLSLRPERVVRWCRRYPWVAAFLATLMIGGSPQHLAARATLAERMAQLAEIETRKERDRAESEAATATALNEFVKGDLLSQASSHVQAGPATKPDPDLKVRTALDRAAEKIGKRFADQPIIEASIQHTIGEALIPWPLFPSFAASRARAKSGDASSEPTIPPR